MTIELFATDTTERPSHSKKRKTSMRIGIIGASNIGGTLGTHWVKAGHEVLFGVRRPMALSDLTRRLGAMAKAASPGEAAVFAETLLFAAPYGAWPEFAAENGEDLIDKVVIDAANPYAQRDGAVVEAVARAGRGAAAYTASLLPMSHVDQSFQHDFLEGPARSGTSLAATARNSGRGRS